MKKKPEGQTWEEVCAFIGKFQEKRRKEGCQDCMGRGRIQDGGTFSKFFKCETCNGTGLKPKKKKA